VWDERVIRSGKDIVHVKAFSRNILYKFKLLFDLNFRAEIVQEGNQVATHRHPISHVKRKFSPTSPISWSKFFALRVT
jgi:hypothetical protein